MNKYNKEKETLKISETDEMATMTFSTPNFTNLVNHPLLYYTKAPQNFDIKISNYFITIKFYSTKAIHIISVGIVGLNTIIHIGF